MISKHIVMPSFRKLNRPVSASSNSLFKDLSSLIRPIGLQFNNIFAMLLLFIVVKYRNPFELYLFNFSSTGSSFSSSKTSSLLFGQKRGTRLFFWKMFHLDWCQSNFILYFRVQISLPFKVMHYVVANLIYIFLGSRQLTFSSCKISLLLL